MAPKRKSKRLLVSFLTLLILLLTYPAIRPLLQPGFFPTMDGHLHVFWAMQMKKSLLDGHFPVRWAEGLFYGYGSPIFSFYAPLFHYLTSLVSLITTNFLSAIKMVLILSFFLSALFMYLFASQFWGPWGGFVSSLAYVYAPYQFVDVYVRGAFPEFLAFPLLPLIFWSFYQYHQTGKSFFFFLGAISLGLLTFSHSFLGLATLPFLLAFVFFLHFQKRQWTLLLIFALGIFLGSFFWLPVIFEKKYLISEVQHLYWDFRDSFVYPQQLVYSPWGYGGNVKGPGDQMSFQIGFPHLIFVFLTPLIIKKLKKRQAKILIFSLLAFLIAVFLTLQASILIWELIPFFAYAYFPWRFLVLVVFFASFIAGSSIFLLSGKNFRPHLAIIVVLLTLALNASFARPRESIVNDKDINYQNQILGLPRDLVVGGDFTPRWVQKRPNGPPESRVLPEIKEGIFKTHFYQFQVNNQAETQYTIKTFYYPGWRAFVDGQETKIEIPDTGTMQIKVPQGTHEIKFIFGETLVRKLADLISVFSLIILVVLVVIPGFLSKIETFLVRWLNQLQKSSLWQQVKE